LSTIYYHTRLSNTDDKITAGAMHSVSALLSDYTVTILPSSRATLVDHKGRHVNVYMKLDPEDHSEYLAAIQAYREGKAQQAAQEALRAERIARLLNEFSDEEILKRLTR
jgi:hypothetical protein